MTKAEKKTNIRVRNRRKVKNSKRKKRSKISNPKKLLERNPYSLEKLYSSILHHPVAELVL